MTAPPPPLPLPLSPCIGMQVNASVQVDASQPEGILITNGEFTSFGSDVRSVSHHAMLYDIFHCVTV